jgi:alkylhydroperoxidase family enzyme
VRFAVARQQGLTEDLVEQVDDGWGDSALSERHKAALRFADAFLGTSDLTSEAQDTLRREFSEPELVELGIGLALFNGLSKMLIALGLEPDQMDTTVVPTPGSTPAAASRS